MFLPVIDEFSTDVNAPCLQKTTIGTAAAIFHKHRNYESCEINAVLWKRNRNES